MRFVFAQRNCIRIRITSKGEITLCVLRAAICVKIKVRSLLPSLMSVTDWSFPLCDGERAPTGA